MALNIDNVPYTTYSVGANEAGQIVEDKFTSAQDYADSAIDTAEFYLATLANLFGTIQIPDMTVPYVQQSGGLTTNNLSSMRPDAPSDSSLTPAEIDVPTRPTFLTVELPGDVIAPTDPIRPVFSVAESPGSLAVIELPERPTFSEVALPGTPETVATPEKPALLNIELPTMPVTPSIPGRPAFEVVPLPSNPVLPTSPEKPSLTTIAIPSITIPVYDVVEPSAGLDYTEDSYSSALNNLLISVVTNTLNNGGTGLGADVEAALWERARNRTELENERLFAETEEFFAARGYEIPPGVLTGRLLETAREINRNNQQLNYEIFIEQAKLAREYLQFCITTGTTLEGQEKEMFNAKANRLLEAAKAAVQVIIQMYTAKIEAFNSRLKSVEIEANVEKIKAEIAISVNANLVTIFQSEIEVFANQLKAIGFQVEVDKIRAEVTISSNANLVQIYQSDIEAYANLLKAIAMEIEVSKIKADISTGVNSNLIALYQGDIESYSNKLKASALALEVDKVKAEVAISSNSNLVQIYQSDTEVYSTQLKASALGIEVDKLKADVVNANNANLVGVYQSDIAAFESKVKSSALNVELAKIKAEIVTSNNTNLAEIYKGDIEAYKTRVATELGIIESIAKVYSYKVAGYEADAKAIAVTLDAEIQKYKADIEQANNQTTLSLKEAELTLQGYLGALGLTTEGQKAIANISAQLAASALSSVNASASLGDSLSRSVGMSYAHNNMLSNSTEFSERHEYPHSVD